MKFNLGILTGILMLIIILLLISFNNLKTAKASCVGVWSMESASCGKCNGVLIYNFKKVEVEEVNKCK